MKLSEIMTRDVVTVSPDETLTTAAEKMARFDTGALPVTEGRRLTGIITDRDLVVRGLARHLDPEVTQVARCMTEDLEIGYEDEDAGIASERMEAEQIGRLLVMNLNDELVGIISTNDLSSALDEEQTRQGGEELSEPASPH
jgi:CBS domain-containing protein